MGRPPRHDAESLLDAAAHLAAEQGPRGVTMTAVARKAGAPSGSVYHRFPGRPDLLAALWLRSLDRFQSGFLEAITDPDPLASARAGAAHVVRWSRENPSDAAILLYSAADFGRAEWPEPERDRLDRANRRVAKEIRKLATALGHDSPRDVEQMRIALIDIPYALVRRNYRAGKKIPKYAEELAADCVTALLTREARA
ncbi:TetR/AcrR family transcriptional regulator [Amycolatopsis minnesotensis]|uniref:TetR/AcrR family transcriptional regulator n=1 Tax=Amycolatopsis minnesotensis TaxID=337894 RepID=A0ABN2QXL5_9PSEU